MLKIGTHVTNPKCNKLRVVNNMNTININTFELKTLDTQDRKLKNSRKNSEVTVLSTKEISSSTCSNKRVRSQKNKNKREKDTIKTIFS